MKKVLLVAALLLVLSCSLNGEWTSFELEVNVPAGCYVLRNALSQNLANLNSTDYCRGLRAEVSGGFLGIGPSRVVFTGEVRHRRLGAVTEALIGAATPNS